jgi:hypothetical protein
VTSMEKEDQVLVDRVRKALQQSDWIHDVLRDCANRLEAMGAEGPMTGVSISIIDLQEMTRELLALRKQRDELQQRMSEMAYERQRLRDPTRIQKLVREIFAFDRKYATTMIESYFKSSVDSESP